MIEKYFGNLTKEEILDEFDLLVEKASTKSFRKLVLMIKDFYLYILQLEEQKKNSIKYLKENACYNEEDNKFITYLHEEECIELLNIIKGDDNV